MLAAPRDDALAASFCERAAGFGMVPSPLPAIMACFEICLSKLLCVRASDAFGVIQLSIIL